MSYSESESGAHRGDEIAPT